MGRLKALLHQCVCELLAGAAMLVLVLVLACWWQYRLCFLVHGLSPTPGLPLPPAVANGANHWQCFSNLSNIRPAGLSNSQSHLSLLVFPASQEKSTAESLFCCAAAAIYTHTHAKSHTWEISRQMLNQTKKSTEISC